MEILEAILNNCPEFKKNVVRNSITYAIEKTPATSGVRRTQLYMKTCNESDIIYTFNGDVTTLSVETKTKKINILGKEYIHMADVEYPVTLVYTEFVADGAPITQCSKQIVKEFKTIDDMLDYLEITNSYSN